MHKPLLLVDIDGVISLSGFDPQRPPAGRFELVEGIVHFLSSRAGELLAAFSDEFELVWCSGWEEKADEHLPRALGLPSGLHHLTFPTQPTSVAGLPEAQRRHWKLAAIDAYAGPDRALAWIDDAFDASCHAWAQARPGPTRLVETDPAIGFTAEQASGLRDWARTLSSVSGHDR
ncbi:MAG: HAD domain-containing protein [Solirubrobacteraceae bacterium]